MNKVIDRLVLCVVSIIVLGSTGYPYSGGSGTLDKPYQIGTVGDWQDLTNASGDWNKHFVLTADIDLQGISITPIAPNLCESDFFEGIPFSGSLDGNFHSIRNIGMSVDNGTSYTGLFGYLNSEAEIHDLTLEQIYFVGDWYVARLAGYNNGLVYNCHVTGTIDADKWIGGLVAENEGLIVQSSFNGTILGSDSVGGLGEVNRSGSVRHCSTTGTIEGIWDLAGLVGDNYSSIENCYSTSTVRSYEYAVASVGGLVGFMEESGRVENSYTTGAVIRPLRMPV